MTVERASCIRNRAALLGHGSRASRELTLDVAEAGMVACDPGLAVERLVRLDGDELFIDGSRHRFDPDGRIIFLGSGKASLKIALALERVLGDRLTDGTVVVRAGAADATPGRIEVLEASHPLPDRRSVAAASRLLDQAERATQRDIVLASFTGGSSALTSLPPAGVSADEKRELHRLLLGAGLPISAVNTVRKHVSAFKGGRFASAVAPARLINLAISDVADDELDVLTDPSVQDTTSPADAVATLRRSDLWGAVPASIRRHLEGSPPGPPDLSGSEIHTTLLVNGESASEAMAEEARAAGVSPVILATGLEGEAAALGRFLGRLAYESDLMDRPFQAPAVLVGCGGESVVGLGPGDEFGAGGPNLEAALAASEIIAGRDVTALFIDTDGSDGGTELAGAISDGTTAEHARTIGVDLAKALGAHRSGEAVTALGDGIETGPTQTNVNDLFVLAIGVERQPYA